MAKLNDSLTAMDWLPQMNAKDVNGIDADDNEDEDIPDIKDLDVSLDPDAKPPYRYETSN